jgi:hypothetical protein
VLKGVQAMGGVDDTMHFVKSWSDGLQATSIRCMHASSMRSGLMLSFVKSWSERLQTKRIRGMHALTDCTVLKGVQAIRVKWRASDPC